MRHILLILLLAAMTVACNATDLENRFDLSPVDAVIPDSAAALLDGATEQNNFPDGLKKIIHAVLPQLNDPIRRNAGRCALLLGISLLCAVAATPEPKGEHHVVDLAGILALASAGLISVDSLLHTSEQTLWNMQCFADAFLPIMTAATAATGGFNSSAALQIGTVFFSDLLMHAMTALFIPAIYGYLGLRAADAALEHRCLTQAADLIKGVVQTSLKAVLFIYTAFLAITGIISGTADATAVKAAKLTLSGVVPVVGSLISDASEAVVISAGLVRNSIGVFGLLAVLAICIEPFLETAVPYLMLKFCAVVSAGFARRAHTSMLDAMGQALGFLLAMTGTAALLLLISFVCYMRVIL